MKISKSKQELARIISENGGWRDGAEWSIQDRDKNVEFMTSRPEYMKSSGSWCAHASRIGAFKLDKLFPNWHQTILSRAEYFFLYQEQGLEDDLNEDWPDADGWIEWNGGECPVNGDSIIDLKLSDGDEFFGVDADWDWQHGSGCDIVAYRLHKQEQAEPELCESVMRSIPEPDEQVWTNPPTIEKLAADYRNAKDYADRKRQEADDAKADAEARLKALELASEAIGLIVTPIIVKQEPELVITDWRDLQAGDVISVSGKWWEPDSEYTVDENDGSRDAPIRVGGYWALIGECSFKFIRRP